jgi:hypothetical protein
MVNVRPGPWNCVNVRSYTSDRGTRFRNSASLAVAISQTAPSRINVGFRTTERAPQSTGLRTLDDSTCDIDDG